jgi:deoxyribodipyrimidine photolyase
LPHELDRESLVNYDVELGKDYPMPIEELASSRERALDAFKKLSSLLPAQKS